MPVDPQVPAPTEEAPCRGCNGIGQVFDQKRETGEAFPQCPVCKGSGRQKSAPRPEGTPEAWSDERIDAMLYAIDDVARDVDSYAYGLPMRNTEMRGLERMREAVRNALRAAVAHASQPSAPDTARENAVRLTQRTERP